MSTPHTIDQSTLERLVEAGAVTGASVVGHGHGWGVVIKYGTTERALAARRGSVREFRKIETVIALLRKIGLSRFSVDASNFDPHLVETSKRAAAASARMRAAHEAVAYNKWFIGEVEQGLAEADDPDTQWVSNDDAKTRFAKKRQELEARIKPA